MKRCKVVYLGPKFTFSHEAAIKYFGEDCDYEPINRINDVFDKISLNDYDYGVAPAENSVGGAIGDTLDLFIKTDLKIYDQITLNIKQNLISLCPDKKDIKKIFSHPQSFFQCSGYIKKNFPDCECIETASNAKAAIFALEEPNSASIGPYLLAKEYGLNILEEGINDKKDNQTKFFIISKKYKSLTKRKSLIIFSLLNKPGTLYRIMKVFKNQKINMTKIESRPSKEKNWEYVFIVEYENSPNIAKNAKLIDEIKKKCDYFDYLGSY